MQNKKIISEFSGVEIPLGEQVPLRSIRESILSVIKKELPKIDTNGFISLKELNEFRKKYIEASISEEIGELSEIERFVIENIKNDANIVSKLSEEDSGASLSFAQNLADKVAGFGGSWYFICSFIAFIVIWILVNILWLSNAGFDPYPFILLNLILSCIAAVQAPLIMMSQNRQEEKDRERAGKDYMINLKSELEIRMLHEKIDHLIMNQQRELLEIQQVQIEMMKDILKKIETEKS